MSFLNKPLLAFPDSWRQWASAEFDKPYFKKLNHFLTVRAEAGGVIYPDSGSIFRALASTPFEKVKVVLLGQDPYHGPGQAHGLSFSVPTDIAVPPSLKNIYKELVDDLQIPMPEQGCLQSWAEQGVLLLNATLTVEQSTAGAHQKQGWEEFTDQLIRLLSEQRDGLVFFLWGAYAQQKAKLIDENKHLIISSAHPSPLSAYRGFFGSKPFSTANVYLKKRGYEPIDWRIPQRQPELEF